MEVKTQLLTFPSKKMSSMWRPYVAEYHDYFPPESQRNMNLPNLATLPTFTYIQNVLGELIS